MVLKKLKTAAERTIFVEVYGVGFEKIPRSLLHEINVFTLRNPVIEVASKVKSKTPVYGCCSRCLKAYLIKRSKAEGFGKEVEKALCDMLKCETGHDGYFIDGDDLVEVS